MNFSRYFMGNKAKEQETIKNILVKIELEDYQRIFIQERFLDILYDDFDSVAIKNKLMFQFFSFITLASSATIPFFVNFQIVEDPMESKFIISVIGIVNSIALGFLYMYKNEKVWGQQRITFELLRTEGYMFLTLGGKYKGFTHKEMFSDFAFNVENIIRKDIRIYFNVLKQESDDKSASHDNK